MQLLGQNVTQDEAYIWSSGNEKGNILKLLHPVPGRLDQFFL